MQAERVVDLGCSPGPLSVGWLLPTAAAAAPSAAAVDAAAGYLAAQVIAARRPGIVQACHQLEKVSHTGACMKSSSDLVAGDVTLFE
jgi:hypothetical protein